MSQPDNISKKDLLKFTDLLPGIGRILLRLPSVVKSIKAGLGINSEDSQSIGRILEANAKKFPNRPALLFEDKSYTHLAFNAIVNQYAHYFLSRGVTQGDVVVVFLQNRPEMVFIISAMAKIGAIASLINANQRGKVLKHSISLDPGNHIIIGEELIDTFEEVRSDMDWPKATSFYFLKDSSERKCPSPYLNLFELIQDFSKENPETTQSIKAGQRYANVFTSGTTGMPKASIQTHKRWLTCYYWFGRVNMNLNEKDVMYISIPFFHTNALTVAWPSAAAGGATIALRRKFSVSNFWEDIRKFDASAFIYIGEICRYLMNASPNNMDQKHRVKKVVGNGLRPDIWKDFKKRFNISQVFELYGAADGTAGFTNTLNLDCTVGWCPSEYAIVNYDIENEEPFRAENGFMQKVKKGASGLLITKITPSLPFAGYTNKEENEKKIFRNVFEKGDEWFNTGDMLRDIGFKHAQFVDRLGDTFRWKGENVSTAEVESIVNTFPLVAESAVYGVQLPHTDGKAGMVAIIPQKEWSESDYLNFFTFLRNQLPSYAVPIVLRICSEFEKTATHKIKKFNLKKEGFQPSDNDPILISLPGTKTYVKGDSEILQGIANGAYPF